MKYLKTYRLFESDEMITTESEEPSYNIDDLNDRFLELRDEGYFTDISTVHDKPLDFSKTSFIPADQMGNFTYGSPREMIEITITKKGTKSPITDAEGNVISHRRRKGRFEIDDIKDTLESTISMVEMDGFEFDSYLVDDAVSLDDRKSYDWRGYYKDIDGLVGLNIIKLSVYFIKKVDDK